LNARVNALKQIMANWRVSNFQSAKRDQAAEDAA
jgi:hypothetical protein